MFFSMKIDCVINEYCPNCGHCVDVASSADNHGRSITANCSNCGWSVDFSEKNGDRSKQISSMKNKHVHAKRRYARIGDHDELFTARRKIEQDEET